MIKGGQNGRSNAGQDLTSEGTENHTPGGEMIHKNGFQFIMLAVYQKGWIGLGNFSGG